jgi:hypothetical protein
MVRLYWVRLSGSSVATVGNDGPTMFGRTVTALLEPLSTNLIGSVPAGVIVGTVFTAALGRLVPWSLTGSLIAAAWPTMTVVLSSTETIATADARKAARERRRPPQTRDTDIPPPPMARGRTPSPPQRGSRVTREPWLGLAPPLARYAGK